MTSKEKKVSKKKVIIGAIVLLCFCVAVFGYVQNAACKEEKGIYKLLQNFSRPTPFPSKSYQEFFYKTCPDEYKLSETFLIKRQCSIPDDVEIHEVDIIRNENGTINCRAMRKNRPDLSPEFGNIR